LKYENKKILSAPLVNTTYTVVRLILYKSTRNSELTVFFFSGLLSHKCGKESGFGLVFSLL